MKFTIPEMARRVAAERTRCHENHASNTQPNGDPYGTALCGVVGEVQFARTLGLPYTWEKAAGQVAGDGGIDFTINLVTRPKALTIDVKTARYPVYLCIAESKINRGAELLVQYQYHGEDVAPDFIGWEWRSVIKRAGLRDFEDKNTGKRYRSYAVEAGKLRQLPELMELMSYRELRTAE